MLIIVDAFKFSMVQSKFYSHSKAWFKHSTFSLNFVGDDNYSLGFQVFYFLINFDRYKGESVKRIRTKRRIEEEKE